MKNNKEIKKENVRIFGLVITILIVILAVCLILRFIEDGFNGKNNSKDINTIIKEQKSGIVYIENSDSKKCTNCKKMKKYLDEKKIDYILYDRKKYSKNDYEKLLHSMSINPSDFNYPAVIYIKDGIMYSNIINIDQTKVIEQFIKDYDLKK